MTDNEGAAVSSRRWAWRQPTWTRGYGVMMGFFLFSLLGPIAQLWITRGALEAFTYGLAGVPYLVTLIAFRTANHLPEGLRDRMATLAAQTWVTFILGWLLNDLWPAEGGDLPVVLGLAVVATWAFMAEALTIRVRARL